MLLKSIITGASGFVASHLIPRLLSLGHEVVGIDVVPKFIPHVEFLNRDLLQLNSPLECDYLFHLAGITNANYAEKNPEQCIEANEIALVRTLKSIHAKKVIFTSSATVYGNQALNMIPESAKLHPVGIYGRTKAHAEDLVKLYAKHYCIARFFNLYGAGQNPQYLIPQIVEQAVKGKILLRSGSDVRDFIYVGDAVEALLLLLKHNGMTVNVGIGIGRTALEVAETVRDAISPNIPIESGELSLNYSPSRLVADVSLLRNLGFVPQTSFKDGIRKTVELMPSLQK